MSNNVAKRAKFDDSEEKAIYGVGCFNGETSVLTKLGQEAIAITVMDYEWNISCDRKLDGDKKTIVISVELTSRYVFDDSQEMEVFLKEKDNTLGSKVFSIDKSNGKQKVEINLSESYSLPFNQIDVFVIMSIKNIKYYRSDWATEYNFQDEDLPHDVVISVGDKEFYMFRNYLAIWSKYFDRLFYGNFKEKNQDRIVLENVDADVFEKVLWLISPQLSSDLDSDEVLEVLKLADRFEIPNLMGRCGKILCDFEVLEDLDVVDRLELADKYNLVSLQIACFEHIRLMEENDRIQFFDNNRLRIRNLSNNVIKNLI